MATPWILDFREEDLQVAGRRKVTVKGKINGRPRSSLRKKAIRERARKFGKITNEEVAILYDGRGVDDWDLEELARGRPRDKDGNFNGAATPPYLDMHVNDRRLKRFNQLVRQELNIRTVSAIDLIGVIMDDNRVDHKGRPYVPFNVKLDAAKFLVDHTVGKATTKIESDINVKMQGILAMAMVNPDQNAEGGYALTQGYIESTLIQDDDDDSVE